MGFAARSTSLACVTVVLVIAGCAPRENAKPAAVARPSPPPAASVAPPPVPLPAPSHIDAVASDPWGRREGISLPREALAVCLREAARDTSGWLLLRVEFEVMPRPSRVEVIEREGLAEPIATCIVAAIANHDELQYVAQSRFVYVTAW